MAEVYILYALATAVVVALTQGAIHVELGVALLIVLVVVRWYLLLLNHDK